LQSLSDVPVAESRKGIDLERIPIDDPITDFGRQNELASSHDCRGLTQSREGQRFIISQLDPYHVDWEQQTLVSKVCRPHQSDAKVREKISWAGMYADRAFAQSKSSVNARKPEIRRYD